MMRGHGLGRRPPQQLRARRRLDDAPAVVHDDAVGEPIGLGEVVRDHDGRGRPLAQDRAQLVAQRRGAAARRARRAARRAGAARDRSPARDRAPRAAAGRRTARAAAPVEAAEAERASTSRDPRSLARRAGARAARSRRSRRRSGAETARSPGTRSRCARCWGGRSTPAAASKKHAAVDGDAAARRAARARPGTAASASCRRPTGRTARPRRRPRVHATSSVKPGSRFVSATSRRGHRRARHVAARAQPARGDAAPRTRAAVSTTTSTSASSRLPGLHRGVDGQRDRRRPARDVAGEHQRGAELAERAREGQHERRRGCRCAPAAA